jgi:lipopolysaccharide/colanic/teichoic acid biosynthesis glycosyltransferase
MPDRHKGEIFVEIQTKASLFDFGRSGAECVSTGSNAFDDVILSGPDRTATYYTTKRVLDVLVSGVLLLILAPLFALIAGLIKLDSRGPIFFVQTRAGAKRVNGRYTKQWWVRSFDCYKFRSMFDNVDESVHRAYTDAFIRGHAFNGSGESTLFKLTHDPRVTRVGRILRKCSLDELPQLLNVLKGDMSLVGPRPVPTYELAAYSAHHWKRLTAQPGVTGLWQVKGRCRVDFEGMVRLDLEYIQSQSIWSDIKLLALTIPAVVCRKGAE